MSALDEVIRLDQIEDQQSVKIGGSTSAVAREKLVTRMGVGNVDNLVIDLKFKRLSDNSFRLSGSITLDVTQTCVITAEPVTSKLTSELDLDLIHDDDPYSTDPFEVIELTEEDDAEYIPSGEVALIDLVTDCLLLELDPYPKADGAEAAIALPDGIELNAPPLKPTNPFAALAALKK